MQVAAAGGTPDRRPDIARSGARLDRLHEATRRLSSSDIRYRWGRRLTRSRAGTSMTVPRPADIGRPTGSSGSAAPSSSIRPSERVIGRPIHQRSESDHGPGSSSERFVIRRHRTSDRSSRCPTGRHGPVGRRSAGRSGSIGPFRLDCRIARGTVSTGRARAEAGAARGVSTMRYRTSDTVIGAGQAVAVPISVTPGKSVRRR